jgi:hypothetical protein
LVDGANAKRAALALARCAQGPIGYNNSFIAINDFSGNGPNAGVSAPGTENLKNGSAQVQCIMKGRDRAKVVSLH